MRVIERTATKTLVAWDVIAARIVTVRGKVQLTSAVLAVDRGLAEEMLGLFGRTRSRASTMAADIFGAADPALRTRLETELAGGQDVLRVAARAPFTAMAVISRQKPRAARPRPRREPAARQSPRFHPRHLAAARTERRHDGHNLP